MNCCDLRRFLSAYLDSELDARTSLEVSEHLDDCADCAERMEAEARLERAIRDRLNSATAPAAFWTGVERAIGAEQPRQRRWVPLAVAAAACGVAIGGWFAFRGPSRPSGAPEDGVPLVQVLRARGADWARDGQGVLDGYRAFVAPRAEAEAIRFLAGTLGTVSQQLLRVFRCPIDLRAHETKLLGGGLATVGGERVPVLHYRCCGKDVCVFFIVQAALAQFPATRRQLERGTDLVSYRGRSTIAIRRCPRTGGVVGVVGSPCTPSVASALVAP